MTTAQPAAPPSAIAGVNLDRLTRWMDSVGEGSGPIADVEQLSGGTQNILLRFRRGDRTYVLRRPPLHLRANSNETMRREARMLAALAGTDVPHPPLIAACGDEAVLGAAFYLMAPVTGFNAREGLALLHAGSAALRRRMGFALVEAIAALGALDHDALGLSGFGKPENYLERQIARWQSQLAGYEHLAGWPGAGALTGLDAVTRWLAARRPAHFIPGIIHGDYHLANVMFRPDGPELAAIVDWELTTIGDPLVDLGWLLATCWTREEGSSRMLPVWDGFPEPEELIAHYAARSRRDLSAIGWYVVFACFKLAILLEGTHARACAGQADPAVGARLHAKAIELLARAEHWMKWAGQMPGAPQEPTGKAYP
jgi:aminoglycoside phosphotransferase (APT) family kinase protein